MYDGMYKLKAANVQCISNTRPNIWQWILTLKKRDIRNHTIRYEKIEKTRKTHTIWTRWDENRYAWTLIHSTIQLILGSAPGAFAKLRIATIGFVVSVCLSLCPSELKQLRSHWADFHEILYLRTFPISAEKIQVSLKSDKSNGYFTQIPICVDDKISLDSSNNEKYFTQKL